MMGGKKRRGGGDGPEANRTRSSICFSTARRKREGEEEERSIRRGSQNFLSRAPERKEGRKCREGIRGMVKNSHPPLEERRKKGK